MIIDYIFLTNLCSEILIVDIFDVHHRVPWPWGESFESPRTALVSLYLSTQLCRISRCAKPRWARAAVGGRQCPAGCSHAHPGRVSRPHSAAEHELAAALRPNAWRKPRPPEHRCESSQRERCKKRNYSTASFAKMLDLIHYYWWFDVRNGLLRQKNVCQFASTED